MDPIKTINEQQFHELMSGTVLPVLVFFTGPNCSACKAFAPTLESIAVNLKDRLIIVKVDVEESPNIGQMVGVRSLPTSVIFKNSTPYDTKIGVSTKQDFINFIVDTIPPFYE